MARELPNQTTVEITCRPRDNEGPELLIADSSLRNLDDDDSIFVEFSEDHPAPSVRVIIRSENDSGHVARAWEVVGSDDLDALDSHDALGCSRSYAHADEEREILIALVPADDPPAAPPPSGSGSTVLKVKVRKSGGMPLPIGGP